MRGYASTEEGDGSADGEEETVMLADVHSSHSSAVSPKQCWPLQRRVLLAVMGCLMWALCYADRTNISLAIVPMSTVFGYSEATQGLILSSFFAGYVCTQVLGGWLALKIGGKPVLAAAVAVWSVATLLTPPAARASTGVLLATRVLMGLGEGMALPCLHHLTARWVPATERSRFLAVTSAGKYVGTGAAMGCAGLAAYWWPAIFYLFGAAGWLWVAAWWRTAASDPTQCDKITAAELAYLRTSLRLSPPKGEATASPPWRAIAISPGFWSVVTCHFCSLWAQYLLISWLPSYFTSVIGLELQQSGLVLLLPYIAPAAMTPISGWLADYLVACGFNVGNVRKMMSSIALIGTASSFAVLGFGPRPSPTSATALSTMAIALLCFGDSGYWASYVDISPRFAGVLLGIGNCIANFAGILVNASTGFILDSASSQESGWATVFMLAILVNSFGCVCFVIGAPRKVLF